MRASNPEFLVFPYRFQFVAVDKLYIPAGQGGNIVRGALGTVLRRTACLPACRGSSFHAENCMYAWLFAPRLTDGPSGLTDPPRPFVLRAAELDGKLIEAGRGFHFDLHLFAECERAVECFVSAFAELARCGLGPARARVALSEVVAIDAEGQPSSRAYKSGEGAARKPPPVRLPLSPNPEAISKIELQFLTPTELKHQGTIAPVPKFGIVFSRLRDRIMSLLALYGDGVPDLDFVGIGERANAIELTEYSLDRHEVERRSSRTGQTHPLGGFTGTAIYKGNLAEFIPWLRAGYWTGVGRQTVWGKGKIGLSQK